MLLEWLHEETPISPLTVVLTNGQSFGLIPERLHSLVSGRVERPRSLRELMQFVNRLEDEVLRRRSAQRTSVQRAMERGLR